MPEERTGVRVHLTVRGRVQGVGFRWFAREAAQGLGLTGWVRNQADGVVELEAQGSPRALVELARTLRSGHTGARVDAVESRKTAAIQGETLFEIL